MGNLRGTARLRVTRRRWSPKWRSRTRTECLTITSELVNDCGGRWGRTCFAGHVRRRVAVVSRGSEAEPPKWPQFIYHRDIHKCRDSFLSVFEARRFRNSHTVQVDVAY